MSAPTDLVAPFRLAYTYTRSTGPVIGRFLGALRNGRLEGVRTERGDVLCPPSEADPRTGRPITGHWVEVGPEAVVTTWAWVAAPGPRHPLQEPFAWALVRPDGADTAMLHVVRAPEAALRTGLRVRAVWASERVGSVRDIAWFEPVGGA